MEPSRDVLPMYHHARLLLHAVYLLLLFPMPASLASSSFFNRNLCGHSTDGMCAAFVTGLNHQLCIGPHKRNRHRHLRTVGNNMTGMFLNFLMKEKI